MMKRSKGKTTITLKAVISGKKVSESVDVHVKNTKTSKLSQDSGISKLKRWREKLQARCSLQPRWNRMLEMGNKHSDDSRQYYRRKSKKVINRV